MRAGGSSEALRFAELEDFAEAPRADVQRRHEAPPRVRRRGLGRPRAARARRGARGRRHRLPARSARPASPRCATRGTSLVLASHSAAEVRGDLPAGPLAEQGRRRRRSGTPPRRSSATRTRRGSTTLSPDARPPRRRPHRQPGGGGDRDRRQLPPGRAAGGDPAQRRRARRHVRLRASGRPSTTPIVAVTVRGRRRSRRARPVLRRRRHRLCPGVASHLRLRDRPPRARRRPLPARRRDLRAGLGVRLRLPLVGGHGHHGGVGRARACWRHRFAGRSGDD